MAVVLRLCNDARSVIREGLSKEWYLALKRFETLPEMKDQLAFEGCLERELAAADPILYAILHAHFLALGWRTSAARSLRVWAWSSPIWLQPYGWAKV